MRNRILFIAAAILAPAAALTGCTATPPAPTPTTQAAAPVPGSNDIIAQPAQEAVFAKLVTDWAQLETAANGACQSQEMASANGIGLPAADPNVAAYLATAADYNSRYAAAVKGGTPGLTGYPKSVPTPAADTNWCAVPGRLIALHS